MIALGLQLATSCLTLLAMYLLSRKDWRGWALGLANQALWVATIVTTHAWGLLLLTAALVVIYVRALIRWRRDDRLVYLALHSTPPPVLFGGDDAVDASAVRWPSLETKEHGIGGPGVNV